MITCREVQQQLRSYVEALRSSDPSICQHTRFPSLSGFEEVAEHLEGGCRVCQEVFDNIGERQQRENEELCLVCGKPKSAHLPMSNYARYSGCEEFVGKPSPYVYRSPRDDK